MRREYKKLLPMYFVAAFIRIWLINSDYQKVIADRVEVSTPLNSWKRVTEGVYLNSMGINPYQGDLLHETPLHLLAYKYLIENLSYLLPLLFILCDIITAHALYNASKIYMFQLFSDQENKKSTYTKDVKNLLLEGFDFTVPPVYVAAAYLFNPYSLFNCVGFTTTVFGNMFLALFFAGMLHGNLFISTSMLALCIAQSLYPVVLLSPLFLYFWKKEKSPTKAISSFVITLLFLAFFMLACRYVHSNWEFLSNTYGFILTVPELRPNVGLFWYFFIEMFEHFRDLFIYSFQINVLLLYFIPLSIRFRKDPVLLAVSLISLSTTFKSYPCLGDVGFVLALLPCWKHLFNYMQQGFLVGCCFLVTTALGPTVWHLWIYSRSANANFYFGVTLAFATAQIFLITDILFAYTKYEFSLKHGRMRKIDGKDAKLVLE